MRPVFSEGIVLKKRYGQHFLRQEWVVDHIVKAVNLDSTSSVFEIGCGDGFLTREIIKQPIARLWVFEIDHEWADYVKNEITDQRLHVYTDNILDVDFSIFEPHKPWTILANLPYQITFPILHMLQRNRHLLKEGVVMVQEEVAQKVVKQEGRGFGFPALFFQHYFELKLLDKIPPSAFYPPPKVDSRLVYLKPRATVDPIPDEEQFWKFIKMCFRQPRRTLKNNLAQSHFDLNFLDEETLALRAQQMKKDDFLRIWQNIKKDSQ